jgi:hypothetical protein
MKIACYALFILLIASTSALIAEDDGDVFVGRTGGGQLKIGGLVPEDNILVLPPVSGIFNGWSDVEPGFDHLLIDEPQNDFLTLQSGVQVRIEVVQVDAAFAAISPGFTIIDDPGERFILGNQSLHIHPNWLINSDHPDFDPLKTLWRGTFKLVDTGSTGYAASAPFTFHFANIACLRGDCNADTLVDARDIQDFVLTVLNPAGRTAEQRCSADTNRDGLATVEDVDSFVLTLLGLS